MLEIITNLPQPLLWLLTVAVLLAFAAAVDSAVTTLAAGRWHRSVRGVLPTVALPVMLLGVAAAAHLTYQSVATSRAADAAAMAEAHLLREAAGFTRGFAPPVRDAVLTGLREYAERVLDKERDEMRHATANPASGGGLLALLNTVVAQAPATPGQHLAQGELVTRLKAIAELRRERLAAAIQPLNAQHWGTALFLAALSLVMVGLSQAELPGGRRLALSIHSLAFGTLFTAALLHAMPYAQRGLDPLKPLLAVLPLLQ